ncbi:hypothetical protein B296_00006991 [Ensete ventricosum]|uniref:Uncharacterized protein n=1 Tax=Ensete ventricosum TaxID=4639 RepID=A0A426YGA0_ENSVE|nr:hypothetical protein B296_00006991 [Ensete ventricosum]
MAKLYNRRGKLAPNPEGPYRATSIIRNETYRLATHEGNPLRRTYHISNLKKSYA